jgi:hypothetical protein
MQAHTTNVTAMRRPRARHGSRGECSCPVHADGAYRAPPPSDLPQQRKASGWRRLPARHRLGPAAVGFEPRLLGKQAQHRSACLLGRPPLARSIEQCRRSRLGPEEDGRRGSAGRSRNRHQTQTWLAASNDSAATVGGKYWFNRKPQTPAAEVCDPWIKDQLVSTLAELTNVFLF